MYMYKNKRKLSDVYEMQISRKMRERGRMFYVNESLSCSKGQIIQRLKICMKIFMSIFRIAEKLNHL